MKVLLDTNIIIHREANRTINQDIGILFLWLDKLHYEKYIHPITIEELQRYAKKDAVDSIQIKITNYNLLKTRAALHPNVESVSKKIDSTSNDLGDTELLNTVYSGRVDILISEDKKIHKKAELLNISDKVFYIETFLEKVTSENPDFINYKVLSVKKRLFGELEITDTFFDSFREDYKGFNDWFTRKSEEPTYVCFDSDGSITAFLFIKVESENENYADVEPKFERKKRLKIGTFKVASNGVKLGERFLKIIFDHALQYKVEEIYVTIFDKRAEQRRLIALLQEWGFILHGKKETVNGDELVYVREFKKEKLIESKAPKIIYPYLPPNTDTYIIRIETQYHSELFPDSILKTESASDFIESKPHRNSISKVYISHCPDRNLKPGDIVLMYKIGETYPRKYSSTITTICIVESIVDNIGSFEDFLKLCRKRTLISTDDLKTKFWDKFPHNKPFIINLLYAHSFPMPKPTLEDLNKLGIIPDITNMGKGFTKISRPQLNKLIKFGFKK